MVVHPEVYVELHLTSVVGWRGRGTPCPSPRGGEARGIGRGALWLRKGSAVCQPKFVDIEVEPAGSVFVFVTEDGDELHFAGEYLVVEGQVDEKSGSGDSSRKSPVEHGHVLVQLPLPMPEVS